MANAKQYAKLKAKGICTQCHARPSTRTFLCDMCANDKKKKQSRLKVQGRCVRCGKMPAHAGKVLCLGCQKKQKTVRAARKAAGRCIDCAKPAANGKTRCRRCREKQNRIQREARQDYRYQGLCVSCGKVPPVDDISPKTGEPYRSCDDCLDKNLEASKRYKAKHPRRNADADNSRSLRTQINMFWTKKG